MNIYHYDLWDGDKGIIIAKTEEEAWKLLKDDYGKFIENEYEQVNVDYVGEVPRHPQLFIIEGSIY